MINLAASHGILDQPGTVAFLVIFGMGVILFFVFRSMAKHLRKINMAARAEAEAAANAQAAADEQAAPSGGQARRPAEPS
ncbi:MAG TPA: hypothetical protein VN961_09875 [Streptosporangiaceae bacterium]|nr:hypothetical protein [Streptosporangiaceae bacterium]